MTLFLLEANNLDFASTKEELEAKGSITIYEDNSNINRSTSY